VRRGGAASDDISALDGLVDVSRETADRLERFVALLRKWQTAENLVAPETLPSVWKRHVADSAQLAKIFPDARVWLDLGSGAGFPGIVLAILLAESPDGIVHLVESNQRKCAFLRQAIRESGASAKVHAGRIEAVLAEWQDPVDMISARALAPLDRLLSLAAPLLSNGAVGAFHKGQDFEREIEEASKSWEFDLILHKCLVEGGGVILEIRSLARKAKDPTGLRGRP
jgi:16S rRNA (guanine527-N7)-methyltransferase